MKDLDDMTREELELEIIFWDIAPLDGENLDRLIAMTTEELRELVRAWVLDGNEAAPEIAPDRVVCVDCGKRIHRR